MRVCERELLLISIAKKKRNQEVINAYLLFHINEISMILVSHRIT